jgi:hypothetical protein
VRSSLVVVFSACQPASTFRLLGVLEYAFVAVRSEADKSTALSTAWILGYAACPPASSSRLLGVLEYAFVAVRSEADESTTLSTAWAGSKPEVARVGSGA